MIKDQVAIMQGIFLSFPVHRRFYSVLDLTKRIIIADGQLVNVWYREKW